MHSSFEALPWFYPALIMFLNLLSQIYFMGTFLLSILVAFAVQYFQSLSGKYLSQ